MHTYMQAIVTRANISLRFSSNSEADASELIENREEMFARHYMHSDVIFGGSSIIC